MFQKLRQILFNFFRSSKLVQENQELTQENKQLKLDNKELMLKQQQLLVEMIKLKEDYLALLTVTNELLETIVKYRLFRLKEKNPDLHQDFFKKFTQ